MKTHRQQSGFEWPNLASQVSVMEARGYVTRTFRRLDPDRQNTVLQAIVEEAAETGPAELNIKAVAARARVSVGSLYQYFGDREQLVRFVVDLSRSYLEAVLEASSEPLVSLPLADGLAAYIAGGNDWAVHQAGVMRLFARAAYRGDASLDKQLVTPVATKMRGLIQTMLEAAVARGELPTGQDLPALAGLVHALSAVLSDSRMLPYLGAYLQLTTAEVDAERSQHAALALLMRGLGLRPAKRPRTPRHVRQSR